MEILELEMFLKNKQINHFFKNVMYRLGYYDWTLNIKPNSSEGYCWRKQKRIDLGEDTTDWKSLLLHEIAHIDTCRFCNNRHHKSFWRKYEDLIRRFYSGKIEINSYNEDVGYFRKVYG